MTYTGHKIIAWGCLPLTAKLQHSLQLLIVQSKDSNTSFIH